MSDALTVVVPNLDSSLPDKRQVAASFSRAATSYDAVAELQRAVGSTLVDCLPSGLGPANWLMPMPGLTNWTVVCPMTVGSADGRWAACSPPS